MRGNFVRLCSNTRMRRNCSQKPCGDVKGGPFQASQYKMGREKKGGLTEKKKKKEFVCMEATIDKMEHMCMCERTRWETM